MDDLGEISRKTVKELRPGSYVLIDEEPCKVVETEFSSPGKHGAGCSSSIWQRSADGLGDL